LTNIKGRRDKIKYRETKQKHPEKRKDRIEFLKSKRSGSDTKKKTWKAGLKV
jgi:hypothetical protein